MLDLELQLFNDEEEQEQESSTTQPFKAFENEDEFSKFTQSISSKAKGEILKELGIKSVAEFKDKYSDVEQLEVLKVSLSEKDQALADKINEYTDLETKYNEVLKQNQENMEKLVLSQYELPETFKDDFKVLVRAGVKDDVTFEQSAKEVYERLNITQVKNKIQIGGAKHDVPPLEEKEKMKKLTQL